MNDRWMELTDANEVADAIVQLFAERGGQQYDEVVSQTAHAVQAAALADDEGAPASLVAAALLHDIGHLFEPGVDREYDLRHEMVAARFLANWFGPEVTEPIKHHVAAKRYLCAVDPDYVAALSPASVHSLALQGGPMSLDEADEFVAEPGSADAVRLRRWDDLAKDPERNVPGFESYRAMLADLASVG